MQIAPWNGGQIYIKYRRVDCTPPGSIRIELMNVNGDYNWLRLTAQVGSLTHSAREHSACSDDTDQQHFLEHCTVSKVGAARWVTHAPGSTCRKWEARAASPPSR